MLCLLAGGNWNNTATAGVWAVNLNNTRTNSNTNIGGRADLGPSLARDLMARTGGVGQREALSCPDGRNLSAALFSVARRDHQRAAL